jgi:hypothetical protein
MHGLYLSVFLSLPTLLSTDQSSRQEYDPLCCGQIGVTMKFCIEDIQDVSRHRGVILGSFPDFLYVNQPIQSRLRSN